jgi:hypothetical protein
MEEEMKKIVWGGLLVVFFLTLLVGVAMGASEKGEVPEGEVYNFTMIIYGGEGNPFWKKVVTGVKERSIFNTHITIR